MFDENINDIIVSLLDKGKTPDEVLDELELTFDKVMPPAVRTEVSKIIKGTRALAKSPANGQKVGALDALKLKNIAKSVTNLNKIGLADAGVPANIVDNMIPAAKRSLF